jgi:hypothetical protein
MWVAQHELPALLATHFVDDHMKKALTVVQTTMYLVVAPRELLTPTTSMVFYTDGSLIDGCVLFIELKRVVLAIIRYRARAA